MTETERTLAITQESGPDGSIVLRVAGELDHHTAPRLRAALTQIPFGPAGGLIVDLSRLEYCDSTGLTVLITAYHQATAAGSEFSIAGLNPDMRRFFEIVGIDQVITLHPTVDAAYGRLGSHDSGER
ncbi:STAS domain-containing protein [Streptomyces sp. NPDC051452]|uniref:STAS domain-containing protein n=1 Tax=Streptomyces sp. NPDC051452 TaxID=3365654 RepID=UPI0037B5C929